MNILYIEPPCVYMSLSVYFIRPPRFLSKKSNIKHNIYCCTMISFMQLKIPLYYILTCPRQVHTELSLEVILMNWSGLERFSFKKIT